MKSLHSTIKSVKTFSSTISRTLSGKVDNHCRHQGATFLGVKFDFDEIGINEFDSDCGDDRSINEGEESNFMFESIYKSKSSKSAKRPQKVSQIGKSTGRTERNAYSKNGKSDNFEEAKLAEQFGTAAVVTEFVFKLFPGRSIFIKKKNMWGIVGVQHRYLSMFAASTVTHSRIIRFFNVLSLVLASIFADTIFFGIYFPVDSACPSMTDKVNPIRRFSCHFATLVVDSNPFPCMPIHLYYVLS